MEKNIFSFISNNSELVGRAGQYLNTLYLNTVFKYIYCIYTLYLNTFFNLYLITVFKYFSKYYNSYSIKYKQYKLCGLIS